MPVSICRDSSFAGRAARRCAKATRAHSATVVRPDEAGFLLVGDCEGEDVDVLVASFKTFRETLTTSVASLYRSWTVKVWVASTAPPGTTFALVVLVLVGGGLRVDVVLAGVLGGFGCASCVWASKDCKVAVVVGGQEEGVAIALRTTSAGLVVGGILEKIVAAC
jgi:hypothetical protein